MNFNMPMAVFGGLALIAAAIYFGPGSHSATAQSGGVQKVALCTANGKACLGAHAFQEPDKTIWAKPDFFK
jgi:hypothetical protein